MRQRAARGAMCLSQPSKGSRHSTTPHAASTSTESRLMQAVALYLAHPKTRTNRLDWVCLDSMIFTELEAFAHHVFTTRGGTGTNLAATIARRSQGKYIAPSAVFWLFGFAFNFIAWPGLGIYLYLKGHPIGALVTLGWWALWLVLRVTTYP